MPSRTSEHSARTSHISRTIANDANRRELAATILKGLPEGLEQRVTLINAQGHQLYGGRVTLIFEVNHRAEAIEILGQLLPMPLTQVKLDDKRYQVWASGYNGGHNNIHVSARLEIVPFIFSVMQGAHFGPNVRLTWLARIGDDLVTVEVDILDDPAHFEILSNDAKIPTARRWRWERTQGFPVGRTWGCWNHWMMDKGDETASCHMFWPLNTVPQHLIYEPERLALTLLLETEGHNEKT